MESGTDALVIGIGGVSNGGKTSVTNSLAEALKKDGQNVCTMHQDDYFKEEKDVPFDEGGGFGRWDEMVAFDMDKMVKDVRNKLHRLRRDGKTSVLIIEGILIFNHRELNELFSLRYFLTLTKEEAYRRRLTRNYEPPDTPTIFDDHVWPMYLEHHLILRHQNVKMIELDGSSPQNVILDRLKSDTEKLLSGLR